jgi:hypothetical protein
VVGDAPVIIVSESPQPETAEYRHFWREELPMMLMILTISPSLRVRDQTEKRGGETSSVIVSVVGSGHHRRRARHHHEDEPMTCVICGGAVDGMPRPNATCSRPCRDEANRRRARERARRLPLEAKAETMRRWRARRRAAGLPA